MVSSSDVWERYDSVNKTGISIPPNIVLGVIAGTVLLLIVILFIKRRKNRKLSPEDKLLTADTIDEMPIDTFIDLTDDQYRQANDVGCYVLYNLDKEKYYVGKSPLCADAINRHIIGKGNPDVFYEKKSGDEFTVQFYFVCEGSAYGDAEELCDDIISVYGENSEVVEI